MSSFRIGSFFLISSVMPLGLAYALQWVGELRPCALCLYQRLPFFLILVISSIMILLRKKWFRKLGTALCCAALIGNAALGAFHAGVEYKFFDLNWCSSRAQLFGKKPETIEDLREQLTGEKARLTITRCDEVPLRILGLSLSGWNVVYCVGCLLSFFIYRRYVEKNKNKITR